MKTGCRIQPKAVLSLKTSHTILPALQMKVSVKPEGFGGKGKQNPQD